VAKLLAGIVERKGDEPALVDERGTTTWRALDERANRLVHALRSAGVAVGDTVAVLSGNRREVFEVLVAAGHSGLVTELLEEQLEGATVYACGPPPMLEAVRELCAERSPPAQLALEMGMACGYGACFGCAVPTHDGLTRLCLEGPVLDANRLGSALFPGGGHQG